MSEVTDLLQAVKAGMPKIADLQQRVQALPEHKFKGMSREEDDAVVWDLLRATRLVLEALDGIPREAVAAALARCMFGEDPPLSDGGAGWVIHDLEDLAGGRADHRRNRSAEHDEQSHSTGGARPPACHSNVIAFPRPHTPH